MKVRDILKRLADDGWTLAQQKGSHRQFTHRTKAGKVAVNGHPGDEIKGTLLHWDLQAGALAVGHALLKRVRAS